MLLSSVEHVNDGEIDAITADKFAVLIQQLLLAHVVPRGNHNWRKCVKVDVVTGNMEGSDWPRTNVISRKVGNCTQRGQKHLFVAIKVTVLDFLQTIRRHAVLVAGLLVENDFLLWMRNVNGDSSQALTLPRNHFQLRQTKKTRQSADASCD